MSTKNRLIQSFITLVPDYIRSKCERHESEIQRVFQVICCMENLSLFDTSQGNITEFFINVRELLRTCDNKSNLGWKGIYLVKHLSSNSSICELLCQLQFVPVLSQYLQVQLESEKAVLLLSVLEMLTDGIIIDRSGYWLSNTLKYLANAILEKSDYTLPHLLAILSNLCFENYVVVNELQMANRSEELLQFLVQIQTNNDLVIIYSSQVVFSCMAMGSVNERMLTDYLKTVLDMLPKSLKNNNIQLIKRCCCILLWMTRDHLILDLLKASPFQKLLRSSLEDLVALLTSSQHTTDAVNYMFFFTTKLLRTQLIVDKEFTEAFIPALIPLLNNAAFNENLLELLADLINITPNLSLNEQSFERLIVNQLNDFKDPACKKSCKILGHVLQILKKFAQLYKMQPSNNRIALMLEPETFSKIVSIFTDFGEEVDQKNADLSLIANPAVSLHSPESRIIVVQCLTIFGDIAFREREQLPIYSDLLAKPNVQQCLASAIVLSDCQIKQDALALIGTVGFNRESLAGLSYAMDQLYSRRGSATNDKEQLVNRSILNVTMSPEQIKKLDKITQNMKHDKFWEKMNKCDVVEMLELQIARREREELRLLHDLDSYKQEVDSLKINILQIGAENDRIMAMLLSKAQLIESKESENRGLSRRVEKMTETQRDNQLEWKRERDRLQREKNKFEVAQTEVTNKIQSQLDAAMKQIRNLSQKSEDIEEELKKSQKSCDALKLTCEKKSKELDKLSHEFQEIRINSDNLGKMVREKEKEIEEKDREIISLNQAMKKSEMLREDLETRLIESEKSCQETKKKLIKLEKIQEFIYDLSSGKNKLFEDAGK